MDPVVRSEMRNIISDKGSQDPLNTEKKTSTIMTTHSMENRNAFYPRISIMAEGKRRCHGSLVWLYLFLLLPRVIKLALLSVK